MQSAGSQPAGYVHPLAIKALAEIGIDISSHRSKSLAEFLAQPVHTVITVRGKVDQMCPVFPGSGNRHHWPFDDPGHAAGTEAEQMAGFAGCGTKSVACLAPTLMDYGMRCGTEGVKGLLVLVALPLRPPVTFRSGCRRPNVSLQIFAVGILG